MPRSTEPTDSPLGRAGGRRRARRLASASLTLSVLVGLAAWAVFLRPTFLGGDTTYVIVSGTSMEPTLRAGDLVLARRRTAYAVGDVVVYGARPEGAAADKLIIHRIVGGSARDGYVLRGDNRDRRDVWRPRSGDVRGALVIGIPAVGAVLAKLQEPRFLTAALAGVLVFLVVTALAGEPRHRRRRLDGGEPESPPTVLPAHPSAALPVPDRAPGGFLVLARAAEGYALVEREGDPPGPGELIVLDGRLFEISGAALSPLLSDRRLCLIADRLAKASELPAQRQPAG